MRLDSIDHILKDEEEYQRMINDREYIKKKSSDPFFMGWARTNQFSYYTPREYLSLFEEYFDIEDLLIVVSPEGLLFRSKYPSLWETLKKAGLEEMDLLVKSIYVVLKKPTHRKT